MSVSQRESGDTVAVSRPGLRLANGHVPDWRQSAYEPLDHTAQWSLHSRRGRDIAGAERQCSWRSLVGLRCSAGVEATDDLDSTGRAASESFRPAGEPKR